MVDDEHDRDDRHHSGQHTTRADQYAGRLQLAARLPKVRDAIKRDGMIWTVTPKGKGGIKDTDVMGIGKAAGLVDVKVVSFSATHSANKFVIPKSAR